MESILFHCKEMSELAQAVAAKDLRIKLGIIDWLRFPDEFPDLYVHKVRGIRRRNVAFLASFESPDVIFEQWSAMCMLPRTCAQSMTIILPYYVTGTMERVDDVGQVATAKTLARLMSAIPGGPEIVTYDIHALQEEFYFGDFVYPRVKSAMKYLKRILATMDDVVIMFPDFGASKRFGRMFTEYQQAVCHKERGPGDVRKVTIVEGVQHVAGANVVIVDDIIKSGGTIIEGGNAALAAGAKSLFAWGTHGSCPKEAWKKFLGSQFQKVWITDSCPLVAAAVKGQGPFEVISLAESIAHVVVDEDDQESLIAP